MYIQIVVCTKFRNPGFICENSSHKHLVHNKAGVIDSLPECMPASNVLLKQFQDSDGCVCIQSSGRLVQEQHLRLNDQLHTDTGPLPLSS